MLTMIAAFVAVVIAIRAPRSADEWADRLRVQTEAASEKQKLKMLVFVSLMKCRAQILHADAIAALNLIDVAFSDHIDVRNAYRSFLEATTLEPAQPLVIVERYHTIIEKIAIAVGMSAEISVLTFALGTIQWRLADLMRRLWLRLKRKLLGGIKIAEIICGPFTLDVTVCRSDGCLNQPAVHHTIVV